jgi:hypothetical protein
MSTEKPPAEIWTLAQSHDVKLVPTAGLPKYILADSAEKRIAELEAELAKSREEVEELNATFDLQWKADMRAVEEWRKQDPDGRKLTLPDRKDQFLWLCRELAKTRETARELLEACQAALAAQGSASWNYHIEDQLQTAIARAKAGEKGASE